MNIVGGTMSIDGISIYGTMSNGRKVVEPCKEHWKKFIVNEHFKDRTMNNVNGTMDNFDGSMNIASATMYKASYNTMFN